MWDVAVPHAPLPTLLRLPRTADAAAHLLLACATAGHWPHQQPPERRPPLHVGHPVSAVLLVIGFQRLFWQCKFASHAWGSRATPGICRVVATREPFLMLVPGNPARFWAGVLCAQAVPPRTVKHTSTSTTSTSTSTTTIVSLDTVLCMPLSSGRTTFI